ncbi:FAD-dependent oxidoreductase [Rhodobacteraceae bacterium F11138]|nr:FAD-dependent oxidoreductase [Rhodobacteraceae bacterium F11138]
MTGRYDVIVAGGGTAGTIAAIASARLGARTLLLERNHCLGGAGTMRNVLTWCGLYTLGEERIQVVRGIADEVLDRQRALGGLGEVMAFRGVFVPFDPETLKIALDELASGAGVDIRFGASVVGATREDKTLRDVTIAHHGGVEKMLGGAFVDCTGDGDLADFAGASTRYGNADGVNLGTLGCRFGGVPASVSITVDDVIASIANQGFDEGQITKDRCVVVRLPGSSDLVLYLASEDYDPRDSMALSRAEISARKQAWNYLQAIRAIPGCQDVFLASTGPEIGTRESRHLNCRRQITWNDIALRQRFDDTIALGAWGAEWHDRKSFRSEFDYPGDRQSYQIPLSCLHSIDTDNLFCAGRLADGDRKGGAAIRVMGTAMATGQAAGTAAALKADARFSIDAVAAELRAARAVISQEDL